MSSMYHPSLGWTSGVLLSKRKRKRNCADRLVVWISSVTTLPKVLGKNTSRPTSQLAPPFSLVSTTHSCGWPVVSYRCEKKIEVVTAPERSRTGEVYVPATRP